MANFNEAIQIDVLSGVYRPSLGVDFQTMLILADDSDVHESNWGTARTRTYYNLPAVEADAGSAGDGKYFPAGGWVVYAAQMAYAQDPHVGPVIIGRKASGDADWGAALEAVLAETSRFYPIVAHTAVEYDPGNTEWAPVDSANQTLANVAAAHKKVFVSLTGNPSASAPTSNAYHLPVAHDQWHDQNNKILEALDVALASKFYGTSPDEASTTVAWAHYNGISAGGWTDSQKSALINNGYTLYLPAMGVPIAMSGRMADGSYADERLIADWLRVRASERIAATFMAQTNLGRKIGYDDVGIGQIVSAAKEVFEKGLRLRHLESYTFDVPKADSIDQTTKASRNLTFQATGVLTGAIHTVTLTFYLTM